MRQYGNIFIRHRDTNGNTMDICCCCCCLLRLNGGINWQLLQTFNCTAFRIYQLCQQQIDFKAADRYKRTPIYTRTTTHSHAHTHPTGIICLLSQIVCKFVFFFFCSFSYSFFWCCFVCICCVAVAVVVLFAVIYMFYMCVFSLFNRDLLTFDALWHSTLNGS